MLGMAAAKSAPKIRAVTLVRRRSIHGHARSLLPDNDHACFLATSDPKDILAFKGGCSALMFEWSPRVWRWRLRLVLE
jgi:hypothetical protein